MALADGSGLDGLAEDSGHVFMSSADLAEALRSGKADLGELQSEAVRFASRLVTDPREQLAKERLFRRGGHDGEHSVGTWVRVQGLQTAQTLNGRSGQVVEPLSKDSGRVGVRIAGIGDKAIRVCNLVPFPEVDTMKVARIYCRGERRSGASTWRWPLRYIADRPFASSPVSERIGLPLHITRWEPDRSLVSSSDFENIWAGHLMMDLATGRVPHEWHTMPGPLVVWRADGSDFSADDLCLVVCFVDELLQRFGDREAPFDPDMEVTPEAFERFKARELAIADDSERTQWWEDLNV